MTVVKTLDLEQNLTAQSKPVSSLHYTQCGRVSPKGSSSLVEGRNMDGRKLEETDLPLNPNMAKAIKVPCPKRRWRLREVPRVTPNITAFFAAGSLEVICLGQCLSLQMKNRLSSDMHVKKGKRARMS